MTAAALLLTVLALALLLPVLVFLVQTTTALLSAPAMPPLTVIRPRIAVLVPAHDESMLIADTLRLLLPQLGQGDRVLVVADNCSDDTAKIAMRCGAEVIERTDALRRGKGYALDFGVRHLERGPPEVVVIVDADCKVSPGSIDILARRCIDSGRPVQALYLMRAPAGASLRMRIAEFAWVTRNQARPLGYHRLGLPCQLMGTGMAFGWPAISSAALASGHIVEDMVLGISLASKGTPPLFCPEAVVSSSFPESAAAIRGQRTRWEHGHLGVIAVDAPRLFVNAITSRSGSLLAMALDLFVPPIALLMLMAAVIWLCAMLLFLLGGPALAFWLASAVVLMAGTGVLLAWVGFGRNVISLASLACAPFYALWKIPLYLGFFVRRQVEWVRSGRERS